MHNLRSRGRTTRGDQLLLAYQDDPHTSQGWKMFRLDRIEWIEEMPRTSTGKSDRARLLSRAHAVT